MFLRIAALMRKEFLSLMKDKKSRLSIIVPPIMQLLVFGYAATYDLNNVPLAVYNEDPGGGGRELVARFAGSRHFTLLPPIRREADIAPLVDSRKTLLVLHIESGFSRNLTSGKGARVQVIVDGRNSNTAMIALGYVRSIITAFNEEKLAESGRAAAARLDVRAWFNPNLESRWFIVPGIVGLLTLVVTLLVTALSVAREREQGTFDQLLVTPMRPVEILIGKALPGLIIGMAEATVIILLTIYWFKIPLRGSILTLYAGLFLFILSAIGVGLMISSLAVTQQQGLLGAFLFLVPAIILSGFTTPIANMPEILQKLTYLNPMRYFMIVLRGVFLEGTPIALLAHQLWPMAAIGIINLSLAGWLFRHRIH